MSGSGSITENISLLVEHHIKDISTKHASYLQDTPHFLRVIDKVNRRPKLPKNAMAVTADVTSAYHNIPQEDGINFLKEDLDERVDQSMPSDIICKLMDLVQRYNIFEFRDKQLWKQIIGVAMGIHLAPSFANIYITRRIDNEILKLSLKYGPNGMSGLHIFKRFLDDIFQVFKGTTKQLHELFKEINNSHPTKKNHNGTYNSSR